MAEHPPRRLTPGVVPLRDLARSVPGLRFAVRFPAAPSGGRPAAMAHEAEAPHPLAGTGKLFLAVAVARLAAQDPGLLPASLTVRGEHRAAARSGTLRRMTGELRLTVDDAMALIVGTGDGACTAALLGLLQDRGRDVLAEARRAAAGLGLGATTFTGLETATPDPGGGTGESWGEGLTGTTTAADLATVLEHLAAASTAQADAAAGPAESPGTDAARSPDHAGPDRPGAPGGGPLRPAVAHRVLGWMGAAFEPAGLAGALPGFGPRTIPHRTVSGFELLTPPGAPGCASVLILPADVGTGRPTACVAAYQPTVRPDGPAFSSREATAALGSLGLAVSAVRR